MNVLVVTVPAAGHLNPMLPLVEALQAQGDRVMVASGAELSAAVDRTGAGFRTAGHGEMDWFDKLRRRTRGAPGDGLAPERISHYFLPRLFGEVATDDMADDVVAAGRELEADVVMFETYALAGPLAAAVLGVPGVHHLISPMPPLDVLELVDDAVCPLWRAYKLDSPGYGGVYAGTTIEISPPSLERQSVPAGGSFLTLRPAPLPIRKAEPSGVPLIYLTMGTFMASVDVFRLVLDALADEPVRVLVTTGPLEAESLGAVPANARVERFVPQAEVLPDCAVVVHHGGSGTMYGSLAHGAPQLVIPQGADNFINGALMAGIGVGISIGPTELSPDRVRKGVRELLDDRGYAESARLVASEIAAMPEASEVARELSRRFGR